MNSVEREELREASERIARGDYQHLKYSNEVFIDPEITPELKRKFIRRDMDQQRLSNWGMEVINWIKPVEKLNDECSGLIEELCVIKGVLSALGKDFQVEVIDRTLKLIRDQNLAIQNPELRV